MALLESDPVVFARTATGDLAFPLRLVGGIEAVGIGCRTRVLMFRGEWFLDLDVGVPWLPTDNGRVAERDAILGQRFDDVKVRAAFLRELLTCPGVLDVPILRASFVGETRELSVSWTVRTVFGDTPLDTVTRTI